MILHEEYDERNKGCLSLTYNNEFNMWLMHLPTVENWTISEYKRLQQIFKKILNNLRYKGIKEIWGLSLTMKEARFTHMFGFKITDLAAKDIEGKPYYISKLEIK